MGIYVHILSSRFIMSEIIVFSKDRCMQCQFLKKELDKKNIEYVEKNVSHSEEYLREFKEDFNGKNLPMLIVNGEIKSVGFNPDVLETL